MLYAIRRLDTRQLYAGFSYNAYNKKYVATWTSASPTMKPLIFGWLEEGILDEIRGASGIDCIFVPVTIGG